MCREQIRQLNQLYQGKTVRFVTFALILAYRDILRILERCNLSFTYFSVSVRPSVRA
jgi:hypothetical protein